jgi:signal transduction histidine kinase
LIGPAGAVIQPMTGYLVYRRGYLGATPYLAGGLIVLFTFAYAFIAHVYPGHFNLDRTLDAGHLALLTESFAFAAAIVIRLLGLQRERDNALKAELVAVREKLDMSAALRDAQKQYLEARKLSSKRRDQLSSVSHDLQQPLAMLRYKIGNMANHDESSVDEMHKALDYLEQLARDQIKADDSDSPGNQSDGAMETFSLNVIFENAKQMFQDDAKAKGLKFRIRSLDAAVDANAVALMRVVGNLLQNAIRHTQSGGILLGARRRGDRIQVEIWDTGGGIKPEEMERVLKRREKGEGSAGAGLGLAIVRDISEQYDLNFRLISKPGRGACARFDIPRHC